MRPVPSDKSRTVALILAAVLGVFGVHRFYVGKIGTGLLMLLTMGGLGIWYLYDVITIAGGSFRDVDGRRVLRWDPEDVMYDQRQLPPEVEDELDMLRGELSDLHERLDFTERLLASRDRDTLSHTGDTPR